MRTVTLILVMALATSSVSGFEPLTGRGHGLAGTLVLSNPSASEAAIVPAVSGPTTQLGFETGYHRRFELRELDQLFLATMVRTGRFSGILTLTRFGQADLYRELTARVGVGREFGRWAAMVSWSGMLVDFGADYERLKAGTMNIGLAYKGGRVHAAIAANNLTSPSLDPGAPGFSPDYTLFTELAVMGRHSLLGRVTLQQDSRPQFGLGQVISVADYSTLLWGVSTSPTQYGGGVRISLGPRSLTCCTRYHPTLGFTHSLALTLSIAGNASEP